MSFEAGEKKSRKRKTSATATDKSTSKIKKRRSESGSKLRDTPSATFLGNIPSEHIDVGLSSLFCDPGKVIFSDALVSKVKSSTRKERPRQGSDSKAGGEETNVDHAVASRPGQESGGNDTASVSSKYSDARSLQGEDAQTLESNAPQNAAGSMAKHDENANDGVQSSAGISARKRKKNKDRDHADLEANYLRKVSREAEKQEKRIFALEHDNSGQPHSESANQESDTEPDINDAAIAQDSTDEARSPPPMHESLTKTDDEFQKAQSTVFLGNVALSAITSSTDLRTLKNHLTSFTDSPSALTSLRFRSTPFAPSIPKRAAFARKDVMDATSHSTNAYAVYATPALARTAVTALNATIVLDRHLRADSVAHPSPVDHRRCVFVGNLGFVDDESGVDAANTADGRGKRKGGDKVPADTEEGLWRTFSKVGEVESVRVIRDEKTRVGKGIAYVQFKDENAVEEALAWDGKKDPPMLPRKMRVSRAKAVKRKDVRKRGLEREREAAAASAAAGKGGGYVRKLTGKERSQVGRAEKLLGKHAGKSLGGRRDGGRPGGKEGGYATGVNSAAPGVKTSESFVFEGQRAKRGAHVGVRMKKGSGKKALPTKNSRSRGAAWKARPKVAKS